MEPKAGGDAVVAVRARAPEGSSPTATGTLSGERGWSLWNIAQSRPTMRCMRWSGTAVG